MQLFGLNVFNVKQELTRVLRVNKNSLFNMFIKLVLLIFNLKYILNTLNAKTPDSKICPAAFASTMSLNSDRMYLWKPSYLSAAGVCMSRKAVSGPLGLLLPGVV